MYSAFFIHYMYHLIFGKVATDTKIFATLNFWFRDSGFLKDAVREALHIKKYLHAVLKLFYFTQASPGNNSSHADLFFYMCDRKSFSPPPPNVGASAASNAHEMASNLHQRHHRQQEFSARQSQSQSPGNACAQFFTHSKRSTNSLSLSHA